jgi:hypothetical protein
MPSLATVAAHWETGDNADTFPNLRRTALAQQEPFCFRCGWFSPIPCMDDDKHAGENPWTFAAGWLERAHLAERFSGGADTPNNLVPLCLFCHREMPELISDRTVAIAWINAFEPASRDVAYQIATDSLWGGDLYQKTPGSRVLLRVRLRANDYHRRFLAEESAAA